MSTLLDDETIVLEKLDDTVACQWCEARAEVAALCRGCRKTQFFCRGHYANMRERLDLPWIRIICKTCGHHGFSFDETIETVEL